MNLLPQTLYFWDLLVRCFIVTDMKLDSDFEPINSGEAFVDILDNVVRNMSTDQMLPYELCLAVKQSNLPQKFLNVQFGPINHACWLTTWMQIVYLWIRNHGLQGRLLENVRVLARFCIESYFKLFYIIKVKDRLEDAPHIVAKLRVLNNWKLRRV